MRRGKKEDQVIIFHITTINPAAAWDVTLALICVGDFSNKRKKKTFKLNIQSKERGCKTADRVRRCSEFPNTISFPCTLPEMLPGVTFSNTSQQQGGNCQSAPGVWKHSVRMLECSLFVINWPTCLVNLCSNCAGGSEKICEITTTQLEWRLTKLWFIINSQCEMLLF